MYLMVDRMERRERMNSRSDDGASCKFAALAEAKRVEEDDTRLLAEVGQGTGQAAGQDVGCKRSA